MPNYGLSINSQFQPFTMQELLAPVASATKAYNELEDAYGKLQSEAEQYRYIASLQPDAEFAQRYNQYATDLEAQAEELASTGRLDRKAMWNMTKRYATDVIPMKTGYEALAADMKTQATTPGAAFKKRVSMND